MARGDGIYTRGTKIWMVLHPKTGKWSRQPTPFRVGQEAEAKQFRDKLQEQLDAGADLGAALGRPPTVESFGAHFIETRDTRTAGDDESRLKTWIYPVIGTMAVAEVRARHIKAVIDTVKAKKRAPRTVINVYSGDALALP